MRAIELRILVLVVLWFVVFGLVLIGYRPGGPIDLVVGLAAIGPILIALVAVRWPPVARGDRAFAATAWLGFAAVLLLIPSIAGIVTQLAGRGPQTLLPSFEAAYPWVIALLATAMFAGLGVARRRLGGRALRRRRLLAGGLNRDRHGPRGGLGVQRRRARQRAGAGRPAGQRLPVRADRPDLEPPPCNGTLTAGQTARLDLRLNGSIDDRRTGQVVIGGIRDGDDVRWNGFAATRLLVGQVGAARIGEDAWERQPGGGWATSAPGGTRRSRPQRPARRRGAHAGQPIGRRGPRAVLHRGCAGAPLPGHARRRHAPPGAARWTS